MGLQSERFTASHRRHAEASILHRARGVTSTPILSDPARGRPAVGAAVANGLPTAGCVGPLRAGERDTLLHWLDAGLRGGRRDRISAEYAVALEDAAPEDHALARVDGRLAAHALARPLVLRAGGTELPAGMIGLVYADPAHRRRGLASACVEAALHRLAARGAVLAMLWSERESFYRRLGFSPGGCEVFHRVDAALLRALRDRLGALPRVREARESDFSDLEAMYAAKPAGVRRAPGTLARAARAPDCRLLVATEGDTAIAYAARGRGDDFPGVVHEWAGDAAGVAACLEAWAALEPESWLLASSHEEPLVRALRAAGAERVEKPLALLRVLDAAALRRALCARPGLSLDAFFVWGFDSI
jgi:GNAT superfamily N-acetyltransferase